MNQTETEAKVIRPTKKQRELLTFIEEFIAEHGYSPSYREVMNGLRYTSVSTVATHINSLISRGHLRKRDNSARSLEVVNPDPATIGKVVPKQLVESEEKWLVEKIDRFFKELETAPKIIEAELDNLYVLVGALKVLGSHGAAQAFIARLSELKARLENDEAYTT